VIGGNWATGSRKMVTPPASTMMMAMTVANTGRSMKKLTNLALHAIAPLPSVLASPAGELPTAMDYGDAPWLAGANPAEGLAPSAWSASFGCTTLPGCTFCRPSVITRSAAFTPVSTTRMFWYVVPATMLRFSTVLFWSTTSTNGPP
jgi:hypothetical protein